MTCRFSTELNLVRDGYAENMAKAKEKHLPLFLSSTMLYRRETQYIKKAVQDFGKPVHYIYHIGQVLPDVVDVSARVCRNPVQPF